MSQIPQIEISEYFRKLLERIVHDACWLVIAIFVILMIVYILELCFRWKEIGRKYKYEETRKMHQL